MVILQESDAGTMFINSAGDYLCAFHITPGQSDFYPVMLGPYELMPWEYDVNYDEIPA